MQILKRRGRKFRRFDFGLTAIRLLPSSTSSTALRPFDDLGLRYNHRPRCCGLLHYGLNKQEAQLMLTNADKPPWRV